MSKNAGVLSTMFAQAGLPPEASTALPALLRRVGYDTDDEGDMLMGMTALASALRVYDEFDPGPQRSPAGPRLGRNDPCPCGSGKKYKKCCLRKAERETRAPGFVPGLPLEDVELIPRLHDQESVSKDLHSLVDLLHEDAELKKMRFNGRKVAEFVRDTTRDKDWAEGAEETDDPAANRDAIVLRYLREVEGIEVLGDLGESLLKAGRKWAKSSENVRALATGLCLTDMTSAETSPSDVVNPLVSALFWTSFQEFLNFHGKFVDAVEKLGGAESLRQRVLKGEPVPAAELEAAMAEMDLGSLETIRGDSGSAMDEIKEKVREGEFPIGLPLASVLPSLVRVSLLDLEVRPPQDRLQEILFSSIDALGSEDLQVFDGLLSQWVQAHPGDEHEETRGQIGLVRTLIAQGSLYPLDFELVRAGLTSNLISPVEGEPEFTGDESSPLKDRLSADWLERYGDFLFQEGYPEMACRTWRLCELHGPLPDSVRKKLRDIGASEA